MSVFMVALANILIQICQHILRALQYLHCTVGVVHNDIKCNNVLIASNGEDVKLCDFGMATCAPGFKKFGLFSSAWRPVKPPIRGDTQTCNYWVTSYNGSTLSGYDVDFYSFVQLCVSILFHDDVGLVLHVRQHRSFPPWERLRQYVLKYPCLDDFFKIGQRFLEERGIVENEWNQHRWAR